MSDRFYIPPAQWDASSLQLFDDEAKHCSQVMRHREGDEVIVFNGVGDMARAHIATINKHEIMLDCIAVEHIEPPAGRVTLAPALIKADRWEWLLEKATELGATEIQPLITERCVVKLGADDAARKHDKWQRIVVEACKQCRRAWVPVLHPARRMEEVCGGSACTALTVIAAISDHSMPMLQAMADARQKAGGTFCSLLALVGPEGDFTQEEMSIAIRHGAVPVSLGPLTLRAETASMCVLSIAGAAMALRGS